jgi:hypothetical protein
MTPDQISLSIAIAKIIENIGTWPIGSVIVAVIFGPWIMMGFVSRSMEKRHEAAMRMYEDNVKLVVNYEKIADEQADTIRLSTAATTELTTFLKTRTPCHTMLAGKFGRSQ